MASISIKIKIADREYPMTVESSEEEPIRKAAKQINESISEYRRNLGISDKLDILAMIAFDAVIENLKLEKQITVEHKQLSRTIADIDAQVSKALDS